MSNHRRTSQNFDVGRCLVETPSIPTSLPLHELNNSPEAPGPMSLLEWRRAVWFQIHSLQQPPPQNKSQLPYERPHTWMLNDSDTNSDSDDELTRRPCRISRLSGHETAKKPAFVPLIDLTQPADADGRPIQFEDGRPKLVSQPNKPRNRAAAIPDIEHRHREAMRRLQAEATEQIIYAEREARNSFIQRSDAPSPKLRRIPSQRAPFQKLSALARTVSHFSNRNSVIEPPLRTSIPTARLGHKSRLSFSQIQVPDDSKKNRNGIIRIIKSLGSLKNPSKNHKPLSDESEASMSRKSLLSSSRNYY